MFVCACTHGHDQNHSSEPALNREEHNHVSLSTSVLLQKYDLEGPWWYHSYQALQAGSETSLMKQVLPPTPKNLVKVVFVLTPSLIPCATIVTQAQELSTPKSSNLMSGGQSRWIDTKIQRNNRKALVWVMLNISATKNKWKKWIQKVLLRKIGNFVLWWPYAVTACLEIHSWHCF